MDKHKCFSRSGWWVTLCGLDAANQGFGWSSDPAKVGCEDCQREIARGSHLVRQPTDYLRPRVSAPEGFMRWNRAMRGAFLKDIEARQAGVPRTHDLYQDRSFRRAWQDGWDFRSDAL